MLNLLILPLTRLMGLDLLTPICPCRNVPVFINIVLGGNIKGNDAVDSKNPHWDGEGINPD